MLCRLGRLDGSRDWELFRGSGLHCALITCSVYGAVLNYTTPGGGQGLNCDSGAGANRYPHLCGLIETEGKRQCSANFPPTCVSAVKPPLSPLCPLRRVKSVGSCSSLCVNDPRRARPGSGSQNVCLFCLSIQTFLCTANIWNL